MVNKLRQILAGIIVFGYVSVLYVAILLAVHILVEVTWYAVARWILKIEKRSPKRAIQDHLAFFGIGPKKWRDREFAETRTWLLKGLKHLERIKAKKAKSSAAQKQIIPVTANKTPKRDAKGRFVKQS